MKWILYETRSAMDYLTDTFVVKSITGRHHQGLGRVENLAVISGNLDMAGAPEMWHDVRFTAFHL